MVRKFKCAQDLEKFLDSIFNEYNIRAKDKYKIYPPQRKAVSEILFYFMNRDRFVMFAAQMLSGKSGTFGIIAYILGHNRYVRNALKIPGTGVPNVFFITGQNDNNNKAQLKTQMAEYANNEDIKLHCLSSSELQRLFKTLPENLSASDQHLLEKLLCNAIIIVDESHHGAGTENVLQKFFTHTWGIDLAFKAKDNAISKEKNLYFISVSATAGAERICMAHPEVIKKSVVLGVTSKYYGIREMLKTGKFKQAFDLKDEDELQKFIRMIRNNKGSYYFMVRLPSKKEFSERVMAELNKLISEGFEIVEHNQHDNIDDINASYLNYKPKKPTIITVKNYMRASKIINQTHIKISHDTHGFLTDTVVQAFPGRQCGYASNRETIIYGNVEAAKEYAKWVDANYAAASVPNKMKHVDKSPYYTKKAKSKKHNYKYHATKMPGSYIVSYKADGQLRVKPAEGRRIILNKIPLDAGFIQTPIKWSDPRIAEIFSRPKNSNVSEEDRRYVIAVHLGEYFHLLKNGNFIGSLIKHLEPKFYRHKAKEIFVGDKDKEINEAQNPIGKLVISQLRFPDTRVAMEEFSDEKVEGVPLTKKQNLKLLENKSPEFKKLLKFPKALEFHIGKVVEKPVPVNPIVKRTKTPITEEAAKILKRANPDSTFYPVKEAI